VGSKRPTGVIVIIIALFQLLVMLVLFLAVQWFYRAGPAMQGYSLSSSEEGNVRE
jgi:hypothetical protein